MVPEIWPRQNCGRKKKKKKNERRQSYKASPTGIANEEKGDFSKCDTKVPCTAIAEQTKLLPALGVKKPHILPYI